MLGERVQRDSLILNLLCVSLPPEAVHFCGFSAGFLTCFTWNFAFPSTVVNSGLRSVPGSLKLTAAGTVQDFHLFPSRDFHNEKRSPKNRCKDTKNFQYANETMC